MKRAHSSFRNVQPDELETFLQKDNISSFQELKQHLQNLNKTTFPITTHIHGVNVKGPFEDQCTKDEVRAVISSCDDERLDFLLDLANMIESMAPEKQGQRFKQLTKDTSHAFSHTCRGMVDLAKFLLQIGMDYVDILVAIQLRKCLANCDKVVGETYFINVQQVLQKVAIRKTKVSLQLDIDFEKLENVSIAHN